MYSVSPYRVSISEVSTAKSVPLWDSNGKGLTPWLYDYLEKKLGVLEKRPENRMVRLAKICANSDLTLVCGRLQTGEYGFTSELVDTNSSAISHERTAKEAEMIPFYFGFFAPKQADWCVLILQRFKNLGIHDFLVHKLQMDFGKAFPGLRLVVDRLVPSTLAKALLGGAEVKTLRLVSHKMPKAVEDALNQYDFEKHVSTTEIVIKAKRRGALPKISEFMEVLDGKKNLAEVVTMPDWNYDSLKLELEIGGRRRMVDIGKPYKVTPDVDITEDVQEGADGHPVWKDIVDVAADLAEDYLGIQFPGITVDKKLTKNKDASKLGTGNVDVTTQKAAA